MSKLKVVLQNGSKEFFTEVENYNPLEIVEETKILGQLLIDIGGIIVNKSHIEYIDILDYEEPITTDNLTKLKIVLQNGGRELFTYVDHFDSSEFIEQTMDFSTQVMAIGHLVVNKNHIEYVEKITNK